MAIAASFKGCNRMAEIKRQFGSLTRTLAAISFLFIAISFT
jgi:hypothetical protein